MQNVRECHESCSASEAVTVRTLAIVTRSSTFENISLPLLLSPIFPVQGVLYVLLLLLLLLLPTTIDVCAMLWSVVDLCLS
jgi:hypothetical protein